MELIRWRNTICKGPDQGCAWAGSLWAKSYLGPAQLYTDRPVSNLSLTLAVNVCPKATHLVNQTSLSISCLGFLAIRWTNLSFEFLSINTQLGSSYFRACPSYGRVPTTSVIFKMTYFLDSKVLLHKYIWIWFLSSSLTFVPKEHLT